MKLQVRASIVLVAILACLVPLTTSAATTKSPRQELAADNGWKFLLGDPGGAEALSFADASWREVDLPHDWSIESKPDKDNPSGAGGGFFPGGIGWYRKTFLASASWKNKCVSVEFDGVYRDAAVYLNGHKLGTHPYLTIDPADRKVVVSKRIREEFENGKEYYRLEGTTIREPDNPAFRPLTENLEYHAYTRYR